MKRRGRMHNRLIYSALVLYAGVALGVDFIATPAKFLAPDLSLAVALQVGRATFHAFNLVEWVAVAFLVFWALVARPAGQWWLVLGATAVILAAETVWLLPLLDERVEIIRRGGATRPSHLHTVYIAFEALKIAALLSARLRLPAKLRRSTGLGGDWQGPYPAAD